MALTAAEMTELDAALEGFQLADDATTAITKVASMYYIH